VNIRIGTGFDAHRFCADRPLFLGGIEFPGEPGLAGHSDADVLLHALTDALLGACAMGDIGQFYPPGDPQTLNIDSGIILRETAKRIHQKGFQLLNADCIIICESPKILPMVEKMRRRITELLSFPPDFIYEIEQIGIKGKTTEKMGFTGRKEGIAAQCAVLMKHKLSVKKRL
jgi:2-C-methyl-D-erythritol 2,4-cyclodiphosphate synthase